MCLPCDGHSQFTTSQIVIITILCLLGLILFAYTLTLFENNDVSKSLQFLTTIKSLSNTTMEGLNDIDKMSDQVEKGVESVSSSLGNSGTNNAGTGMDGMGGSAGGKYDGGGEDQYRKMDKVIEYEKNGMVEEKKKKEEEGEHTRGGKSKDNALKVSWGEWMVRMWELLNKNMARLKIVVASYQILIQVQHITDVISTMPVATFSGFGFNQLESMSIYFSLITSKLD